MEPTTRDHYKALSVPRAARKYPQNELPVPMVVWMDRVVIIHSSRELVGRGCERQAVNPIVDIATPCDALDVISRGGSVGTSHVGSIISIDCDAKRRMQDFTLCTIPYPRD